MVTKTMRSHVTQFPELEKQNKRLREEIQSYRLRNALWIIPTNLSQFLYFERQKSNTIAPYEFLYIRAKANFSLIIVAVQCKHSIGFSINPSGETSLSLSL